MDVYEWARQWGEWADRRWGREPEPPAGIDAGMGRRLVGAGRRYGEATRQRDYSRASFLREDVSRCRGVCRAAGLDAERLFQIGVEAEKVS